MKKILQFVCICAVSFLFVNASVWEGAAAASTGTELPETGLYIATNSFPGNTMVDITNLENGKTIQVIVSSGLDTPGLLAVLSKDAAEAIGLPARSLGRIRMTQPADTIAFSRYTEGLAASGDPDYDPAAFVAMNGPEPASEERPAAGEPEIPEHGRVESGDLIVDMPDEGVSPVPLVPVIASGEAAVSEEPSETETAEASPETELVPEPVLAETPPAAPVFVESEPAEPELAEAPAEPETIEPGPALVEVPAEAELVSGPVPAEASPEPEYVPAMTGDEGITSEKGPVVAAVPAEAESPVITEPAEPEYDLALVPAETRPPEKGPEPDPLYFIPGIVPAEELPPQDDYIDPALVIEPARDAPLAQTPPENVPMEYIPVIPPELTPAESFSPAAPVPVFSAPVIGGLEKGKYYLQLAAYSKAETVHSELARIDSKLPLAIMPTGSADKPVYRILIGPVNLGESGALLQRFKTSYKDAFVRLGT